MAGKGMLLAPCGYSGEKSCGGVSRGFISFLALQTRERRGGGGVGVYFLQLSCCESGYFEGGGEVGSACFLSFFFSNRCVVGVILASTDCFSLVCVLVSVLSPLSLISSPSFHRLSSLFLPYFPAFFLVSFFYIGVVALSGF